MKISIITVVKNCELYIDQCIKSVLAQDHPHVEYIIIDGKSEDATLEIVRSYELSIGIIVSEEDLGFYHALNKGLALATGEIIGIINADDYLASNDVLSSISDYFNHADCDAIYGNLHYISRTTSSRVIRKWTSRPYKRQDLQLGWMPAHPTLYIKKTVYDQHEWYQLKFGISADYELILRFFYQYQIKAHFVDKLFVIMRVGGMSNGSISKVISALKQDFRAISHNGLSSPLTTLILKKVRKLKQFFELDLRS